MMEAASTSETTINFYHTTRRNIPEDSHLQACRRENLKPPILSLTFTSTRNVGGWWCKKSINIYTGNTKLCGIFGADAERQGTIRILKKWHIVYLRTMAIAG
jgi:hypothetical protein